MHGTRGFDERRDRDGVSPGERMRLPDRPHGRADGRPGQARREVPEGPHARRRRVRAGHLVAGPVRRRAGGDRRAPRVGSLPRSEIARARLFRYTADSFNGWGVLGSLSTISHVILIPITLPLWILVSSGTESAETRHVI